jgi:glycosyltransferase involved in cell wall biosynthesis
MKIFQVITVSEYGGAQSVAASLLAETTKISSNEVYVLYGGEGEAWSHLDSKIKRIRLNKHRKGISIKDLVLLFKLFYYRLKYKPDIVHLHSSKMGLLGRIAFNKRTIVYTVHGFDSIRIAYKRYLFLEKLFKNRAAAIVGVSNYDVSCLKEEGISKNVKKVYNGIEDHTSEQAAISGLHEQLSKIRDKFPKVIMCISRISPQKKFELFLELAKQKPEYAFVWIGNKETVNNLPENVFCMGECHSAHQNLIFADIFILPSNYEGLPVSVIEALSYSKPVIASAVGGMTEMLDGENGFAVENTVSAFSEKIDYILHSEERLKEFSYNARQTYINHFTIDKMITEYNKIYTEIYNKNID